MTFIPDEFAETVSIPVRIVNGRVAYFYSGRMPRLKDGSIGELVLPTYAVEDVAWRQPLSHQEEVEILSAGTSLLLAMRFIQIPPLLYDQLFDFDVKFKRNRFLFEQSDNADPVIRREYGGSLRDWVDFGYVEICLAEPLILLMRGTKHALLKAAACETPALNIEAASLNHAYSLASEAFEPARRSHTGNAFQRARFQQDGYWRLLDDLRNTHETAYERKHLMGRRGKSRPIDRADDPDPPNLFTS